MKTMSFSIAGGSASVLLSLGFTIGSHAAPTVVDSFQTGGLPDYVAGIQNLIGQGPVRTGFTGNWVEAYGGAQSPDVSAIGLSYTDGAHPMNTSGGSITYAAGGFGRAGRGLSAPLTDATSGTVYFAVLMKLDSTAPSDNYRGFEMHQGSLNDGDRKLQIVTGEPGVGSSDANFTVRLFNNTAAYSADLGAPDTDVNLFVGKMIFSDADSADQVMIWRNPADISSEGLSGAPDASFSGFNLQIDRLAFARFNSANGLAFDEVRFGTTWSDVTTVANTNDSDNDGLPDDWEISHSLDPNDDGTIDAENGAAGDPDIDGSPNLQEFQRGTDPRDEDSDNDGIFDGNETDTGTFLSAGNTGTDPLDPDSDNDGLRDGAETATGTFVSETDTGTNPNLSDSDGDDVNDGTEVAIGTNPNAADAHPPGDTTVVGIDWFDYPSGGFDGKAGGDYFDNDNSTLNDPFVGHLGTQSSWFDSFGDPQIVCGTLRTRDSGSYRAFNGPASGGEAVSRYGDLPGASATTFYFKIDVTFDPGVTYGGLSFYSNGTENLFFGMLGDGSGRFGVEETGGGGGSISGDLVVPGQTYTLVGVIAEDGSGPYAKVFIDPDLGAAEPEIGDIEFGVINPEKLYPSAIRIASGGTGAVVWDDLVLATTWASLSSQPLDGDLDDLRDAYEISHTGDLTTLVGATANNDTDSLTNGQEQANGTNPLAGDTDGDTLADDLELVDGTNPCLADTDGDELQDNWETNNGNFVSGTETGTDPKLADTDSDGFDDGFEVAMGSDPNDGASTPETLDQIICNGIREAAYGPALAVQTVQTQFGDNLSELDAAYGVVRDGKLFLMFTGNIENNFNKIHVFIDSSDEVTSNVLDAAGNDFSNAMDGLTFDTGFSPDYHVIARRGFGSTNQFDLDFAALASGASVSFTNLFGGSQEGSGQATGGTGSLTVQPIGVGYLNANTAGVAGGTQAADQAAASAVSTGFELCIDLDDIGGPNGTNIKVLAFVTSSDHTFSSNQFLGGLPVDRDGAGLGTANLGTTSAIDLSAIAGDQWFSVSVPAQAGAVLITDVSLSGGILTLNLGGLVPGSSYLVQYSPDLATPFVDVSGSAFTATSSTEEVTVAVSGPKGFYRIATQ